MVEGSARRHALCGDQLLGRTVVDESRRIVGTLEDLVFDDGSGHVHFGALAFRDVAPRAPRLAVAVRDLSSTDGYALFFPTTDRFEVSPPGLPTGATRTTRFIGSVVSDPQGLEIGRIADVVIDMNAERVHYAAISFAPHVGLGTERVFAVPLHALTRDNTGYVLSGRYEWLARLAGFDPRTAAALNDDRYLESVRDSFSVVFPPDPANSVGATR